MWGATELPGEKWHRNPKERDLSRRPDPSDSSEERYRLRDRKRGKGEEENVLLKNQKEEKIGTQNKNTIKHWENLTPGV